MVDTQDLKSCGHNGCVGSSPTPGTERASDYSEALFVYIFFTQKFAGLKKSITFAHVIETIRRLQNNKRESSSVGRA